MRKMIFRTLVSSVIALTTTCVFSADEVKVVYPSSATEIAELDSSTVSKRAEPPVREETEFDPVTPLGQIRAVRDSLTRTEEALEEIRTTLKKDDDGLLSSLFPLAKKSADDGAETKSNVETLLKTTDGIGAKLDALAKTTENLRATVESAQKTAASIEKIRTSRWTDVAVFAILALVAIQLLMKVGSVISGVVQSSRERLEARIYEKAEQLVQSRKTASASAVKKETK